MPRAAGSQALQAVLPTIGPLSLSGSMSSHNNGPNKIEGRLDYDKNCAVSAALGAARQRL